MTTTAAIRPLSGGCGAIVEGIDLSALSDHDQTLLARAHADHGVLFFHDQQLSPEAHIALARRWGEIDVNKFFRAVEGYPEIAEVRKEPDQQLNIGGGWHTDHSYDAEPAMGSILVARTLPASGGDTLFASMYAAYEALSPGLQATLDGLRAVHSSRHVFGDAGAYRRNADTGDTFSNPELAGDVVHPAVITHPLSGRRALYVNPGFTLRFEGWTEAESRPLLDYLYQHASRPEFCCRFRWRPGSVAFWDNRATWHYALNDYQGQRRVMHRITIRGGPLH